jgi:putative nucleotidyltransferase with HDIG domain
VALALSQDEIELAAKRSVSISRLSKLPPFHPAAMKLMTISTESDSAVFDFEWVFRSDPALATDLLIFANSPLFGLQAKVSSIRHAIALMGLDAVRSLGYTVAMHAYTRGSVAKEAVNRILSHSIATAVIAEAIGKASGGNAPVLYTAGLMHDVGRLGLLNIDPERYANVLSREYYEVQEAILLENLMFGCAHDDAGAFLAKTWGLPVAMCDCIRFHHQAVSTDAGELFQGVWTACHMANALEFSVIRCVNSSSSPNDLIPPALRGRRELALDRLKNQIELTISTLTGKGVR